MRTRALIGTIVIVGVVALAAWSWTRASRSREAGGALAALDKERVALNAKLVLAGRRLAQIDAERARQKTTLEELQKTAATAAVPAKPAAPTPRQSLSITELIRNEPDAEVAFLAAKRGELAARYGPLFRTLGLTPEQAAAFQDHYIRREEARMDLEDVRRAQGAAADGKAVEALQRESEAVYAAAQRALLGEEGYRQLQDYERTAWTRGTVSAIAGVAAMEDAPFAPDQADRLVQAIAQASASYRRGGAVLNSEIDWDAVDQQARAILTPAQYAVFSTMDPGPTRGGLLQTRMYALISRVTAAERAAAKAAAKSQAGR